MGAVSVRLVLSKHSSLYSNTVEIV